MSNDEIQLSDLRDPVVLVSIESEPTLTNSRTYSTAGTKNNSRTSNGNVVLVNDASMNNNEAAKLLDVTESDSESDLNLQFTLPKRKVRFKRKFRSKGGGGKGRKQGGDGSTENTSCLCHCSESLGIIAFLALCVCLAVLMWFHYNLSSKVDHLRKQTNSIEAQCKETPEVLHDYHIQLKFLDSNVSTFGDELKKINSEILTIKKDVEKLKQSSADIKASIAAAPEIKTLPKDVVSLSGSVASIGSKISALESVVKDLKEQQSTFASTAETITKQQDVLKENMQEILNTTARQDSDATSTPAPPPSSSSQQVTDAIAQINSSLTPKIVRLEQLYKIVDAVNTSLARVQESNNHTHEVTHSLQKYVHENLTQRVSLLEDRDIGGGGQLDQKAMEDILNTKLSQALECCGSGLSSANGSNTSWSSLFANANQMVGIYLQLYTQLSPESKWSPTNGTEVAGRLLNTTLAGLFKEHNGDIQKLRGDLASYSSNCESTVGQVGRNLTLVSRRVDQALDDLGALTKDVRRLESSGNSRDEEVKVQATTPQSFQQNVSSQTVPPGIFSTLRRRAPLPLDPEAH